MIKFPRNSIPTSISIFFPTFTTITCIKNIPFFECIALDYICRPNSLENICAFDFFEQYEVVKTTSKNKDDLQYFNNSYFQHSSYQPRKKVSLKEYRVET